MKRKDKNIQEENAKKQKQNNIITSAGNGTRGASLCEDYRAKIKCTRHASYTGLISILKPNPITVGTPTLTPKSLTTQLNIQKTEGQHLTFA